MKILYIHQYFRTPKEPGGTRSYWISQELLKNGHEVTMITANPKATVDREEKMIDGIKVIYLKEDYDQRMSVAKRLKAFIGFVWKSIREAKSHKEIEFVIATSTPLSIGITALYLKWFKRKPYLFEVRDLWPEVPIQMGAIKNKFIIWATKTLEKVIYKNAAHVVALSPGMQEGVLKYISKERTTMIPNMSKIDQFWPREKSEDQIQKLGLKKESLKVIYFGAMGLANYVESLLDAAHLLKEEENIEFLLVGDGSQLEMLKEKKQELGLKNVHFYSSMSMTEMSETLNICAISYVSFKDLPILYTNSPNKLFDSLSAGKTLIVNSAGWTKDLVEKYNCGYFVYPNKPDDLAEKIKFLQNYPEKLKEMGENARKLAETKYDKSILCKEFVKVVESIKK